MSRLLPFATPTPTQTTLPRAPQTNQKQLGKKRLSTTLISATLLATALLGCSRVEPVADVSVSNSGVALDSQPLSFAPADWPMWRGTNNDGIATDQPLPTTWSESQGIVWSVNLPGRGHSSPIVCQRKVFLATADESTQEQRVLAFDLETGEELWNKVIHQGGFTPSGQMHNKSTQANGTLACDGHHVYAVFLNNANVIATALDLAGELVWQETVGTFASKFGYAPSPILYHNFVIVAADHGSGGYLAALDRTSGKLAWRKARPSYSSYSTARIANVSGKDQLVISGCLQVAAYDPANGDELWNCQGTAQATCGTIVANDQFVFASGGYPESQTVCVKADGSGKIVWSNRNKLYEPSLILVDQKLFGITDKGIGYCWQADTGEQVWQQRLDGGFSASPIICGQHLYVSNLQGTTFVLDISSDSYREVARNQLGNETYASPAVSEGHILIRSVHQEGGRQEKLHCIGPGFTTDAS